MVVETDVEFESWTCQSCSFILSLGPPNSKELDPTHKSFISLVS